MHSTPSLPMKGTSHFFGFLTRFVCVQPQTALVPREKKEEEEEKDEVILHN